MKKAFKTVLTAVFILALTAAALSVLKDRAESRSSSRPAAGQSGAGHLGYEQNSAGTDIEVSPGPRADILGEESETGIATSVNAVTQAAASAVGERGYSFSCLEEADQRLYLQMLTAIRSFSEDTEVETLDESRLEPVFQSILSDHPEIFYVDGYTYTTHTLGEEIRKITFTARYTMTQSEMQQKIRLVEDYASQCLQAMPESSDDYGIVRYLYDYIIEHTEYNLNAPENQSILSVFLYGESVCQGYAKALQYLLMEMDIPSVMVTGTVKGGESHAWNLVKADGDWYYVDSTWGDAYYRMGNTDPAWQGEKRPSVNYDYLCVTTQQLTRTHFIDNAVPVPVCTAMADNYYVREGAYFDTADMEQVAVLFGKGYEEGSSMLTLKCADFQTYDALKSRLLDEQTIFNYLRGDSKSVTYVDSVEQLTLSFWLN